MTSHRDPLSELAVLLDALEADLLGASPEEVQAALRETGQAREGAAQEVRALLRGAEVDGLDGCPLALPCNGHHGMGTQRH